VRSLCVTDSCNGEGVNEFIWVSNPSESDGNPYMLCHATMSLVLFPLLHHHHPPPFIFITLYSFVFGYHAHFHYPTIFLIIYNFIVIDAIKTLFDPYLL